MLPPQVEIIWGLIIATAVFLVLAGAIIAGIIVHNFKIRESERKFKLLFDQVFDAILIIDNNRRVIVDVNESACNLLGYTKNEISNSSLEKIIPEGNLQRLQSTFDKVLRSASGYTGEATFISKSGKRIEVEGGCVLTRIADKAFMIGSFRDITDRKRAEEALRESEKLAATGRMAAGIAHEINNPLSGIKNSFLLIKDAIPADHAHYEYVGRIEKEIDRIANIVRQMFDLYRKEQESARRFLIYATIGDVVALLEPSCRQHEISVEVDISAASGAVTVPESSLRQVLFNLIQNAVEASPPGGIIKVGAARAEGVLTISISDQGSGIPEEIRPRIFEPFFTAKSDLTTGGLGLGLSVSKRIVEAMAGSLDFETEVGQGSTFRITLPLEGVYKEVKNG